MFKPKPRKPVLSSIISRCPRTLRAIIGILLSLIISVSVIQIIGTREVSATVSNTINFQARLESATGAIAPDGNYNIEFKLYDAASSGTLLWTEDHLNNTSTAVHVVNGYLTVNLGSVTSFGTLNWNQQMWLTMNVGNTNLTCTPFSSCVPDGEMSPRIQLTALPYAFQAGELGNGTNKATLDSSGNLVLQQAATFSTSTGNLTVQAASALALQTAAGTTSSAVSIQSGNASGGASGNIVIDNGTFTSGTPSITLGSTNARSISIGNASSTTTLSIEAGTGTTSLFNGNTAHTIQIAAGGSSTAQTITIGSATNTSSTLTLQGGNSSTAAIIFQTGNNGSTTAGGITIGNTTGAFTQAIAIGTNATASSTTNVTIGSTIAGTTTLQSAGGVAISTLGTTNSVTYLCRNGSNIIAACQTGATGSAFVQGGNNFGGNATLGTTGASQTLTIATGGTNRLTLDTSNNFTFQQAATTTINVAAATTGTQLTIQGGAANSGTNVGGTLLLQGGAGSSTGASGSVIIRSNTNNSTTAFQVQNASSVQAFGVDTVNNTLVVGADGTTGAMTIRGGVASASNTAGSNITFDASNGTGVAGSGDLIFRTAAGSSAVVTKDNSWSTNDGAGATVHAFTWSSGTPAISSGHSNYLLIIAVTITENASQTIASVTYNGSSLTQLAAANCNNATACRNELWYMVNPTHDGAGHNVVVTLNGASTVKANYEVGAVAYYNVDQTTPLQTAVTSTGQSTSGGGATFTPGSGITTTTNQIVLDVLATDQVVTNPGSQTVLWNTTAVDTAAGGSKPGTGGTVTFTWTSNSANWADILTAVNPVTNTTPDTLTDRLHITAAGNVGIGNASPQHTLDVAGDANVKVSSTTAFQVQNASSTPLFTADTTNSIVTVRSGSSVKTLGSELYSGNFSVAGGQWTGVTNTVCGTTGWYVGVSTQAQHCAGNVTSLVNTSVAVTAGTTYRVSFKMEVGNCSNAAYTMSVYIGGTWLADLDGTNCTGGTYTYVGTAASAAGLTFTPNQTSWTGTVSTISIKSLSGVLYPALAVTNSDGSSNLEVRVNNSVSPNMFIGLASGANIVDGILNLGLGASALQANTSGSSNVALGEDALYTNTTGSDNIALGVNALFANSTGTKNIAIGTSALETNTVGIQNAALGYNALQLNSSGSGNSAFGTFALLNNSTGSNNVAIGISALQDSTSASNNTAVGYLSLINATGGNNTSLGYQAGYSNTTGSGNTAIGYNAGNCDVTATAFCTLSGLQNATAIGTYAQVQASNSIVFGGVDTATKVGIGTTIPNNTFVVSPLDYQTGTATRTNGSSTLVGTGTTWTSAMVGDIIIFADGTTNTISSFTDATHVSMATTYGGTTDAAPVYYRFHHIGLQVTTGGYLGINTVSPATPLDVNGNAAISGQLNANPVTTLPNYVNLAPNWSFEVNNDANTSFPDQWYAGGETTGTVSVSSSNSTNGQNSMELSSGVSLSNISSRTACYPISPSQAYSYSVDMKASAANASGFVWRVFYFTDSTCTTAASTTFQDITGTFSNAIATSWQTLTGNKTSPSNAYFAYIRMHNYQTTSTDIFVDSLIATPTFKTNLLLTRTDTAALQIQNAGGTSLFTADTSNLKVTIAGTTSTFADLLLNNAHFTSTQTTAPTIGAPTSCGTAPSSTIASASTDSAGSFTITTGSSFATNTCQAVITFNKAYGSAPKSIVLSGATGVSARETAAVTAVSTTSFTVNLANNAAASTAYTFYYWVIE